MTTVNAETFARNIDQMFDAALMFDERVTVVTDRGNIVLLSEKDFASRIETAYLASIPGMEQRLIERRDAPDSEFVPESEVEW